MKKIIDFFKIIGLIIAGAVFVTISIVFLVTLYLFATAGPITVIIWVIYKLFFN